MKKTLKLTFCAMMAALAAVIMLVSYFPYLTYAVPMFAGLFIMAALFETDKKWALVTYLVAAGLSLILGELEAKVMFICFFGYYPILKAVLEKVKNRVLEYILKLLCFNAAAALVYFALARVVGIDVSEFARCGVFLTAAVLLLANITFLIYDFGLSKASLFYYAKIHERISRMLK